ncbi:MAG: Lrp/AsnC family transcriptional regulator [Acidimicrobiales bacterium]|nr:Lrp/AsnC family transcriptional regulator [Acidimicrobiales bacterium]MCB9395814.1 Lrp/AsnC family transcriptional regulator [Acidimicrobiaceae bacterium]
MSSEIVVIDQIDREILRILRNDARIGWNELGSRIRLSPNAAADRVRRLARAGVIRRFTVDVDQSRLGRTLEAVIDVRLDPHEDSSRFRDGALQCEEVTWLAHVTGRTDFQVHAACSGTAGLNALLRRFREEFGALETETTVVLDRAL